MKSWQFYDETTGVFLDRVFSGLERALAANTPEGTVAYSEEVEPQRQRFDIATGKLVDYTPPRPAPPDPADDYAWNPRELRWQLTPEAEDRAARRAAVDAQIAALNISTIEALRDFVLARDGGEAHRARLAEIDDRIRELRKSIKRA